MPQSLLNRIEKLKEDYRIYKKDKRQKCNDRYPATLVIGYSTTVDGGFAQIEFCLKCNDYRYKDIRKESLDSMTRLQLQKGYSVIYPFMTEEIKIRQIRCQAEKMEERK